LKKIDRLEISPGRGQPEGRIRLAEKIFFNKGIEI
jgi:hypothetical protein